MSKCHIRPEFEYRNKIVNVKRRYLAPDRMSKYDFKCQNTIFGLSTNVKIVFGMSKYDMGPLFERQNRILNIKT